LYHEMDLPQVLNGRQRIRAHDYEVRELSRLNGAQLVLFAKRLSGCGSRGLQRLQRTQPGCYKQLHFAVKRKSWHKHTDSWTIRSSDDAHARFAAHPNKLLFFLKCFMRRWD